MANKGIKTFTYGNHKVTYDMKAFYKAVENLEFDEEGNAYATAMLSGGCEIGLIIHSSDDWEADDYSDFITIPASEIYGHIDPDGYDDFIITSIGGYDAEVTEL